MGSIKSGKDADIVLWTANPLSVYAKVAQTYVDGKLMFDIKKDKIIFKRDLEEKMRIVKLMSKEKNSKIKKLVIRCYFWRRKGERIPGPPSTRDYI